MPFFGGDKMNFKKVTAIIIASAIAVSAFAGCAQKDKDASATTQSTQPTSASQELQNTSQAIVAEQTVKSVFEAKDKDGNALTLVPVYNGDKIICAYVLSVKDKSGKALTANDYSYIGSVTATDTDDGGKTVLRLKDGKMIKVNAYADENGNIIAIQDTEDIDSDKNTEEYFVCETIKDNSGNYYIRIKTDSNGKPVNSDIKTDKDGNKTATDKSTGKESSVSKVDSSNKKVSSNAKKSSTDSKKKQSSVSTTAKSNTASTTAPAKSESTTKKETTTIPAEYEVKINLTSKGADIANDYKSQVTIKHSAMSDDVLTINGGGNYYITQSASVWCGGIVVKLKSSEEANIKFAGVNIDAYGSNAVYIDNTEMGVSSGDISEVEGQMPEGKDQDAMKELDKSYNGKSPNVDISFVRNTTNKISARGSNVNGVIYNESKLTIQGNGSAEIGQTHTSNCAINSIKSITVKNVNLSLIAPPATEGARGIYSLSSVTVESGKLTVGSGGDCIRCDDFLQTGGSVNLTSGKADGIDSDDLINITGGQTTVQALTKSGLKVRRVNNSEDRAKGDTSILPKDCIVDISKHGFYISGGTIKSMAYKNSTVQNVPEYTKQRVVEVKASDKKNYLYEIYLKNEDDSNTLFNKSTVACKNYVYSDSSIVKPTGTKFYKVALLDSSGNRILNSTGKSYNKSIDFAGMVGVAKVAAPA